MDGGDFNLKLFLETAKLLVSKGLLDFVPRRKNMMSLSKVGLLPNDVKDEILDLQISNYYSGPAKDHNGSGEVWIFKKQVNKKDFYIKLKIEDTGEKRLLKCISFHEDEC